MLVLPSSTPAERPYTNLINSTQFARNNFRPTKREWKRTVSPQESPSALQRNLKHYWGYREFRHPQLEICTDALRGCDLIVVAPTGLGKSLCFQLPAVTIEHGVTIVISPLKALMSDQVQDLQARGIKAVQLSEYSTQAEHNEVRRQLALGHPEIRLLYVTPEMLLGDRHKATFDKAYSIRQVARLVVDEAHVITEWGTSFRGKYRELGIFRERYPDVPITALTASATHEVRTDIIKTLRIRKGYGQWVLPFNRRNLFYEVRYQGRGCIDEEDPQPQKSTTDDIADFLITFRPQAMKRNEENGIIRPCVTGIIYCRTVIACEDVAEGLRMRGIRASTYYKSLSKAAKDAALEGWKDGSIECIVATIAFGMGIDQANVRYVIHHQMPKTFEGYYQETGRAGRDGHAAHCIMYYSREDARYLRQLVEQDDAKHKRKVRKDTGDASANPTSSSMNSFKALQHYAENLSKCRHIGVCAYFGEKVGSEDPEVKKAYCEEMCDVCKNSAAVRMSAMQLTDDIPVASAVAKGADGHPAEGASPSPEPPAPEGFDDTDVDEPAGNELLDFHGPDALSFGDSDEPESPAMGINLSFHGDSSNGTGPSPVDTPLLPPTSDASATALSSSTKGPTSSGPSTIPASHTPRLERDLSWDRIAQPIRVREIIHIEMGGEPGPTSLANKRKRSGASALSSSPTTSGELEELELQRERELAEARERKIRDKGKQRAAPAQVSPQVRGVRYVEDSEEGTGSELKLTREQRMKAERMLNSVEPVRGSGPYSVYNVAAPAKYRKVSSAGDGGFRPPMLKSPTKVRCDLLTKASRDRAVLDLTSALKSSLGHGDLARRLLRSWGRQENGSKRTGVLVDVARAIERDIAENSREDPPGYERKITEFRKATKALRSSEVVDAIVHGELLVFDDGGPEVGHLQALEKYMVEYVCSHVDLRREF
ncbi:hypothetical protein IAT38_000272 [Cryptococcus sp. DSM 104549]